MILILFLTSILLLLVSITLRSIDLTYETMSLLRFVDLSTHLSLPPRSLYKPQHSAHSGAFRVYPHTL